VVCGPCRLVLRSWCFARHGAGEQEDGAAKHESVANIVEAVVEAGTLDETDGEVDDEFDEEHGQAQPSGGGSRFLADEQEDSGDGVNCGGYVSPNGVAENVVRSERFERDGGDVIGVEELFEAVEEHGNGDEVAGGGCEDAAQSRGGSEAGGESQRAAAEG